MDNNERVKWLMENNWQLNNFKATFNRWKNYFIRLYKTIFVYIKRSLIHISGWFAWIRNKIRDRQTIFVSVSFFLICKKLIAIISGIRG